MDPRGVQIWNGWITVVLLALLGIFCNLLSQDHFVRVDLTREQEFTLSPAARGIVESLSAPVTVEVFLSQDLPGQFAFHTQAIRDKLSEFAAVAPMGFDVTTTDPGGDDEARNRARRLGVSARETSVRSKGKLEAQVTWLGLSLHYKDHVEVLPFIDNLHSLEYDIARALRSMQTGGRLKVVGAATGHGEADLADAAKRARHPLHGLAKRLTDSYELRTVDLHAGVPEDIDVLLILGSRQTWPDAHLYAVDQHVARGGSLGLFSLQAIPNMQTRQVGPAPVDFARLTAGWGLSISPEIIVDRDLNGAIRLPVTLKTALGLVQGQQQVNSALVPLANILDQEHAITRRLSSLAVPFASPLDSTAALANEALSVTHLASTGPTSRVGASFLSLEPKYLSKASDAERHGPFPVLVSVQGPLDSNWKGQPAPAGVAALGDPSLVAGDLGQQRAPDGTRILVGSSFEMPIANPGLLIAAIDWLAADETLLAIRPRLSPPPFLDFPDDFPTERVKQANVLGIPLLVLLVSGIRLHRRWRGGVTSQSDSSAVDSR